MIIKILCMLLTAYLCIRCYIKENYEVSVYWLLVTAYWSFSILGG